MLYLSGAKNPVIADDLAAGHIGLLNTPRIGYCLDGVAVWAMDNGCFTGTYPGDDEYIAALVRQEKHRARCLFVAAPDVVGDAEATLALFPPMAARIHAAGWPVALVGQDGMEDLDVPWDDVDWLFVGGSTEWKLGQGAERLIGQAKAHGKKVHVGRVNSARRFAWFRSMGADTADGTTIAFSPKEKARQVRDWTARESQSLLWVGDHA